MHELGHTIGLGHPDQAASTQDPTNSLGAQTAVMRSSVPITRPDTAQSDDILAMQYYYPGTTPMLAIIDVDGNGATTALTDGLLIIRRLFGFGGSSLISGAVGAGATRSDATTIQTWIDGLRTAGTLDIDGNGTTDALTDGLMIVRYLFAFRGTTLISGAIGPGATRTTAAEIEAYLNTID